MSSQARGVFVAGTDTGVGKTVVACALARGLRRRGQDVGVMKPLETGVGPEGPADARALRAAAGCRDSLDWICPQGFGLPAAPSVAAAAEGRRVDLDAIGKAFAELRRAHAWLVVEGAGGILVPISEHVRMVDLAGQLGLPVLVVARGSLGTINHTLLTLEALAARRIRLGGVVISHGSASLCPADAANLDALRRELGPRLLGELPPLRAPDQAVLDGVVEALTRLFRD